MKKLLSIVLAVLMVVSVVPFSVSVSAAITASTDFASETRDGKTGYFIDTKEDLWAFAESSSTFSGETVYLVNDLTINSNSGDAALWSNPDKAPSEVWPLRSAVFEGTFDGQGKTISGLYYNGYNSATSYAAFIPLLAGTVKNLALVNSFIGGGRDMGALVGEARGTSLIDNCYVDAYVYTSTNNAGGFMGHQAGGGVAPVTITNSWFNGVVCAYASYASGFVGNQESNSLTLNNCLNSGSIYTNGNTSGLSNAIYNGSLTVSNSVNTGRISRSGSIGPGVTFTLRGSGTLDSTNCYTVTDWSTTYGVDFSAGGTINGVALDADTSNYQLNGNGQTGITFAQSKAQDTFAGLDFTNTWAMGSNGPELKYWASKYEARTGELSTMDIYSPMQFSMWELAYAPNNMSGITANLRCNLTLSNVKDTYIRNYAGTFNGNGYSIYGLKNSFVKVLATGGVIKNLALRNGTIDTTTGAIAYNLQGGSLIDNCYTNAKLSGDNGVSGIAYILSATTIDNPAKITNTWFDGTVTNTGTFPRYSGGFVGNQNSGHLVIDNCLNTGSVLAPNHSNSRVDNYIAGFSPATYGGSTKIYNSVNLGTVKIEGNNAAETPVAIDSSLFSTSGFLCYRDDSGVALLENCYFLEGSANAAGYSSGTVSGTGNLTYGAGVTTITLAGADDLALTGWHEYEHSTFGNILVPGSWYLDESYEEKTTGATQNISTLAELQALSTNDANTTYVLTADIEVSSWTTISTFNGVLDGNGHTLTFTCGKITNFISTLNGTVKNLSISGAQMSYFVNALYGQLINCSADNTCSATSTFINKIAPGAVADRLYSAASVSYSGIVAGAAANGTAKVIISNCWFDGTIAANDGAWRGGIMGNPSNNLDILYSNCLNTADITSTGTTKALGGITGSVYTRCADFEACVNLGMISDTSGVTGAAIGYRVSNGTAVATNCYWLAGSAKGTFLDNNTDARVVDGSATVTAADYSALTAKLGWGTAMSNAKGTYVPVPACFADNMYDISYYKANNKVPAQAGKIFAGWFTDSSCETALGTTVTTGVYYAKFVDEDVFNVAAQLRDDGETSAVRFLTTVDSLNYQSVGFDIIIGNNDYVASNVSHTSTNVYSTVVAAGKTYSPLVVTGCEDSAYVATVNLVGIPESANATPLTLRVSFVTLDGSVVVTDSLATTTVNALAAA